VLSLYEIVVRAYCFVGKETNNRRLLLFVWSGIRIMQNDIFLKPKLTGGRFENHTIPLDFLADLSVLREIITDIAKSEFKKQNPNKKRIPSNFTNGIDFGLSTIETGSVILDVTLILATTNPIPTHPAMPYLEQARDVLIRTITNVESNKRIQDDIPITTIKLFNRFGRGLEDGEAIELSYPNTKSSAKYTKQIREGVLSQSPLEPITQNTSYRGYVIEIDRAKMIWTFLTIDGIKMTAPITPSIEKDVHKALEGYTPNSHNNARIFVEGDVEISPSGITKIISVDNVEILNSLDVGARLEELKLLKEGWFDGQGSALDTQGLTWLTDTWDWLCPETVPLPYLYPTPNGNIQAEWSLGKFNLSLEIDIRQQNGVCQIMDMSTGIDSANDQELSFNFKNNDEWKKLFDTVQKFQNLQ
jgi:hypothetical protein